MRCVHCLDQAHTSVMCAPDASYTARVAFTVKRRSLLNQEFMIHRSNEAPKRELADLPLRDGVRSRCDFLAPVVVWTDF